MLALILTIALSVLALFAIGHVTAGSHRHGLGRDIQRGVAALAAVGASARPVEQLRG